MKKEIFENFISEIHREKVFVAKMTKDGKWYEQEFTRDFENIEAETKYLVKDNDCELFTFKSGKEIDNTLRTFVTQYINKYMCKQQIYDSTTGELKTYTKETALFKLKENANGRGYSKHWYYPTNYGIGFFCLFFNENIFNEIKLKMDSHLRQNQISFENEFSEARWVYRFMIKQTYPIHQSILSNLI